MGSSAIAIQQGTARAGAWNQYVPVGTPCIFVNDDGVCMPTETTSEAWCLGHGHPVVKVKGRSGGQSLDRVIPKVASQPTHALICDLEQSRLIDGETGIGTCQQCVKLFHSAEQAEAFAVTMIRNNVDSDDIRESPQVLEDFQFSLGGLEWFHVFPVVA